MGSVQILENPAGFWVRLLAQLIDGVILGIPSVIIYYFFPESIGANILLSIISVLYSLLLPVIWNGQTVGKRVLKIRIRKVNGEKVGFGTMLLRTVVAGIVYGITLGIAIIASIFMVAFRKDKRSVHDFIAGTYVGK